jgi:hypothetical protein
MNETFKSFMIKLTLSIPALCVGILSLIKYVLKPLNDLWFPQPEAPPVVSDVPAEKHEFH